MIGEMEKRQIMQNLFGDQSEDEKVESERESHQSSHHEKDRGPNPENEHQTKSQGEAELPSESVPKNSGHCQGKSSRSPCNEKDVDPAVLSASVVRDVFGDTDSDEKEEDGGHNEIDKRLSVHKKRPPNIAPDENATYECQAEHAESNKLKGKYVDAADKLPLVFEIPSSPPSSCSNKMATFNISNIIGVDPKPFDPNTFVEENYYVTDTSGSKRHLPSANIIRWRQVSGPDGKISLESNARFVTWSDGSLQLLIGNERFNVSEQAVEDIQSHLFVKLKHEKGSYQAQGRITRKMRFMPSSLSSNSHQVLTAMVNSRNQKGSKVKQYVTDVDPEFLAEEQMRVEKQIMKAEKQLKGKKKKAAKKYKAKGHKGKGLASEYLEDPINKNHYEPELSDALLHFELDQEKEAAAEKRLLISKKGPTDPSREKPVLKDGLKGGTAEGSILHGKVKEVQEEHEEIFEDSEDDATMHHQESKAKGMKLRSSLKKMYIESDEETPTRRIATRRQMAMVYDSSEEDVD
ncbi:protein LEO1 homolog isoform X2 [Henckelia pumila]|uniref:protein LEO1 homolog isoform X2 n=1 Tax=Henckelia pumila TaxID=405737 RepID=UPI003C6E5031